MTDAEQFLQLARELRAMGATQVAGFGFTAIFPAAARTPAELAKTAPEKASKRKPLPTDAAALRELQYAKELGKA